MLQRILKQVYPDRFAVGDIVELTVDTGLASAGTYHFEGIFRDLAILSAGPVTVGIPKAALSSACRHVRGKNETEAP